MGSNIDREARGPLEGIRVVDLTHALAGPMCTYQMASYGADVIKVEPPRGDDFRPRPHGRFAAVNAGKRSIVLDLKSEQGRTDLQGLIANADVVVENFRPGSAVQLGLDWTMLHERDPRLISCSISGFGQSGPMSQMPAIEWSVQAASGMASVYLDDNADEMHLGIGMLDPFTGYMAFTAVMTALFNRERTGKGARLDIAMLDAAFVLSCGGITSSLMGGPHSLGRRPSMARFKARDRSIFVAALDPRWMKRFLEILGAPHLLDDERFATSSALQENAHAFIETINSLLGNDDAHNWEAKLIAAGIPAGATRTLGEAASSEQAQLRNLIHTAPSENGEIALVGGGFGFPPLGRASAGSVPRLGEHTEAILSELHHPI